ncbi:uncharacterized protein LOC115710701 [Cannabis sativa]|uniref:uncharacterized protein LOC115710701 n=1 Tax=Cannabis sativa TaxID=3483 RepID=UPI0011DF8C8B|nr:uncharacterized protein LOC115710701 [Cannabis sativa]
MGDLNNVCSHEDKRGGNRYPKFLIQGFQQALNDSGLQDMELCGCPFTWERGRGTSHWVEVRLDRFKDSWDGSGVTDVQEKIKICGQQLSSWGKEVTGNFKDTIKKCKSEEQQWKLGRDEASVTKYKQAKKELVEAYVQREVFWRQRSKQLWLQEGDNNSKYFHAYATNRRHNDFIAKLKDDNGNWVDWSSGLPQVNG